MQIICVGDLCCDLIVPSADVDTIAAASSLIEGIEDEELYRWFMLYSLHGQSKDAFSKVQLGCTFDL